MKLSLPKSILFSTLLASTLFVVSMATDDDNEKIVGGKPAKPGDYPYFVNMGGCGGALVAPDIVLTARHCGDYKGEEVIIGAYKNGGSLQGGAQKRTCKKWVADPSDPNWVVDSDFALCKLDKPVEIDESKIKLELNDVDSFPKKGDDLKVMGLGTTSSGGSTPSKLHHVEVPYITNKQCNKPEIYHEEITEKMLCAGFLEGGKDSCQGDSGGPIIQRTVNQDGIAVHTHVGVVSWGEGCAKPNKPGVYARTSSRFDWIKKTICDDFKSVASFCNNNNNPAPSPPAPSPPAPSPQISAPTDEPELCEDSEDFLWRNRRNCKKFVFGKNKDRLKKKCNKKYKDDFVYNWCPARCAEKANVGPCA